MTTNGCKHAWIWRTGKLAGQCVDCDKPGFSVMGEGVKTAPGACAACGRPCYYRLFVDDHAIPWCCGKFACEVKLRDGVDVPQRTTTRAERASIDASFREGWFEGVTDALDAIDVDTEPCARERVQALLNGVSCAAEERAAVELTVMAGRQTGMSTNAAVALIDDTERVFALIEQWADKMRDRGVGKLYDTAARYHLGLAIKAHAAKVRREATEACASRCAAWAEETRNTDGFRCLVRDPLSRIAGHALARVLRTKATPSGAHSAPNDQEVT